MTTNNHTTIPSSPKQPASAATFNGPLGELDEAIGNLANLTTANKTDVVTAINELETNHNTVLAEVVAARGASINLDTRLDAIDTRVGTIIAGSETSSTETVDARGGYTVLLDRLDDINFASGSVRWVDAAFGENRNRRYTTISAALTAASEGDTILIAPGTYTETVTVSANNIKLIGSGQPDYDSGTGRLINGTVIRGRIRMITYTGLVIRDLGVDMVGSNNDCIESSNIVESPVRRTIQNVTILGNGFDSSAHGIYASGDYYLVSNVRIINTHHGIAIHGRYGNFSNIIIERTAGSSIIIKSKASVGSVEDVNVTNVTIWGDASSADYKQWGGPLVVQAADGEVTRNINISNVTAEKCVNGVVQVNRLLASGIIEDVHFTNVSSKTNHDLAGVGDYWLTSGANLVFVNCSSTDRNSGYGWNAATATDNLGTVYLHGCTSDVTGSGSVTGTFTRVEVNGAQQQDAQYVVSATKAGGFGHLLDGYTPAAGISITGANTPVASLLGTSSPNPGYAGIVFVHARSSVTTAGNTASYVLLVWREANSTTATVVEIAKAGQTTGAGASAPSFTWTVDGTNNHLEASPVASTSGTFFLSFSALGHIQVAAV